MNKRKGFTLIELIVVMAIIGILVLLGAPKYKEYVKDTRITKIMIESKELEKASQKYYIQNNDWPRLTDIAYNSTELEEYARTIYNKTGTVVTLDENGSFYNISYAKLKNYVSKPKYLEHYILQNPVGMVYYLENLTGSGEQKLEEIKIIQEEEIKSETNSGQGSLLIDNDLISDLDDTTYISLNDKSYIVDIEGDLSNKVINVLSYRTNSTYGLTKFKFLDTEGKELPFFAANGTYSVNEYTESEGGKVVTGVVVPKNAVKLVITDSQRAFSNSTYLYDVYMNEDVSGPSKVSNVKTKPGKVIVGLNWTNPSNSDFRTVYILRDGKKIGESTSGYFKDTTGVSPKTDYTYTLISSDNSGNISPSVLINAKTLERDAVWSGGENYLFDDDILNGSITITSKTFKATWAGDLTNKTVNIISQCTNSVYGRIDISVLDSNGNNLSFYDTNGVLYTSIKTLSGNGIQTVSIIIPESAVSIDLRHRQTAFSGSAIIYGVYEGSILE